MNLETTLTELQQTILEHLRRSKEPVSDFYFQHRLTYDNPELTMKCVTHAIGNLIESKIVTVSRTLCIDREKVRMLQLAQPIADSGRKTLSAETRAKISEAQRRRVRCPMSDETKRKLSEVFRGRKFSEETKRRISEAQRRRWREKAVGIALA